MKKYIKLSIFSLAVASLATSCDMDAPSKSAFDVSSVFSVYALAEQEVMSINVSFGETNSYRGRYLPYYGVNSDVETSSGSYPSLSKKNDDKIVRAPRPADLFRNSIATPALVASIINGKYVNALPLERQSKTFKCNGINLNTNTMANWVINSAETYLSFMYERLLKLIYESRVIHADETPTKVMRIDGQKISNGKKTYMWVYRNRPSKHSHPIVLYEWQPSRRADHPREFLKDFSGTVVTDGY